MGNALESLTASSYSQLSEAQADLDAPQPKATARHKHNYPTHHEHLSSALLSFAPPATPQSAPRGLGKLKTRTEDSNSTDLKRFARHGGPDLSDLRAYQSSSKSLCSHPSMKRSQSGLAKQAGSAKRPRTESSYQTSSSRQSKLGTAYDPAFEQKFKDNGVFMDNRGPKPNNWTDIQRRLAQPRRSLSPTQFSESKFAKFQEANEKAKGETTTMTDAFFPYIAGESNILSEKDVLFDNLLSWPVHTIKEVKPDSYDGSEPSDLRLEIREMLSKSIEPSTDKSRPILANCFQAGKGPKGDPCILRRQALRDGAEGARGIQAIRNYIDPLTAYDAKAYTMTSTYQPAGGLLILYTVHVVKVTGKDYPVEYHMMRVGCFAMLHSPATFREGATWLRNGRDLMKEYRDIHIAEANKKYQTQQAAAADQAVQAPSPVQPLANTQSHVIVAVPPLQPAPRREGLRPCK